MAGGENRDCLLCGEHFDSEDDLLLHHEIEHEAEDDDDRMGWLDWLLFVPGILIIGWRWMIGLFIIAAIGLGALGVFDKDEAPEVTNCAGYSFVRELRREAQIDEFQSVEPESGWACEYSLNDEEAFVRFKRARGGLELEIEGSGRSNDAYAGASELADAQGYHDK